MQSFAIVCATVLSLLFISASSQSALPTFGEPCLHIPAFTGCPPRTPACTDFGDGGCAGTDLFCLTPEGAVARGDAEGVCSRKGGLGAVCNASALAFCGQYTPDPALGLSGRLRAPLVCEGGECVKETVGELGSPCAEGMGVVCGSEFEEDLCPEERLYCEYGRGAPQEGFFCVSRNVPVGEVCQSGRSRIFTIRIDVKCVFGATCAWIVPGGGGNGGGDSACILDTELALRSL